MKLVQMIDACQELIDVMGLGPEEGSEEIAGENGLLLIPDDITAPGVLTLITKCSKEIRETDVFTDATLSVLAELKLWPVELNEPEENNENAELIQQILSTEKLAIQPRTVALKNIVKTNPLFVSMRKTIAGKFAIDEIQSQMLSLLNFKQEVAAVDAKKEISAATKSVTKQQTKTVGSNDVPSSTRTAPAKHVGSVAEYIDTLVQGGITWDELERLTALEVEKRGMKTHYGKKALISSVQARLAKNPGYLGNLKMTENGIE
jgi:hypothetical protein